MIFELVNNNDNYNIYLLEGWKNFVNKKFIIPGVGGSNDEMN